jgi:hypothetical protein
MTSSEADKAGAGPGSDDVDIAVDLAREHERVESVAAALQVDARWADQEGSGAIGGEEAARWALQLLHKC